MRITLAVLAVAALVHVPAAAAWSWPVEGPVLQGFVFGNDPYAAGQHRGIDIGAPEGTSVRAAAAGTVSFAGTVPNSGRTVTVQTAGGLSVTYLELGATSVTRGADVAEGDQIGTIGSARHVHFGVRVTADPQGYLDPLLFLPARVAPATEAESEPAVEPSPTVEPVPPSDPLRATEQPADSVAAEPEASPAADSAEAVPPAEVEPASAGTSVAQPQPVAVPTSVLEPVPLEPMSGPAPSPTVAPVPLDSTSEPGAGPPLTTEQPAADSVAAEPEASPAADSAEAVPPAAVEPESAETPVAEPEPVAVPDPVLEPAPGPDAPPTLAPLPFEPAASEPGVDPALQPLASSVADVTATVKPAPTLEPAPVGQSVTEPEPAAERSPVLDPVPVAEVAPADESVRVEPGASAPEKQPMTVVPASAPPVLPVGDQAPGEQAGVKPEPVAEPSAVLEHAPPFAEPSTVAPSTEADPAEPGGRPGAGATFVAGPAVEAVSSETPAREPDRAGPVVVLVSTPTAAAEPLASNAASARIPVPVGVDPAVAQPAPEASPRVSAATRSLVEPTLPTASVDAALLGLPVIDRAVVLPMPESVVDSPSTHEVSNPHGSIFARVRRLDVVTARSEQLAERVVAGLPAEERTPVAAVIGPTPTPNADSEIIDLALVAFAGFLALGLLVLAGTSAVRRRDRSSTAAETAPVVVSTVCPPGRTGGPLLLHACVRTTGPGWPRPAVRSRRLPPARPLPRPRRRPPASITA